MRIFKKFQTSNKLARESKPAYKTFVSRVIDYKPSNRSKWVILSVFFLLITIIYFLFNLQFSKSELLSDEISYLTKAAAISGYNIDDASSFYAGYPILLSPLFLIFDNPVAIRIGVFFVNSVLFASSLLLLFIILEGLFKNRKFWAILMAVIASSLYPSWIIMAGHAFATPLFLFLFMISLLVFLKLRNNLKRNIILGILTGLLFWVHPMGVAPIGALFLILLYQGLYERRFKNVFVYSLIVVFMAVAYMKGVHVLIAQGMTPSGFPAMDHYSEALGRYRELLNLQSWLNTLVISMGRVSYVVISTFGIVVFGIIQFLRRSYSELRKREALSSPSLLFIYILLTLIIILVFSSLSLGTALVAAENSNHDAPFGRIDHWLYGRYTEMALLPLLGIGVLSKWRFRYSCLAVAIVVAVGVTLQLYVNGENTNFINNFMVISIPSFWPWALHGKVNFLLWSILGGVGILIAGLLTKRFAIVVILPLVVITIFAQGNWHNREVFDKSNAPALSQVARSLGNNCVGTDPSTEVGTHQRNRLSLYAFYLYDQNFQRMTQDDWINSSCAFYFTHNPESFVDYDGVRVLAREDSTQLFIFTKAHNEIDIKNQDIGSLYTNNKYPENNACVIKGCFKRLATGLSDFNFNFIGNGRSVGGALSTNGSVGYLFYGPYLPISSGEYRLILKGVFSDLRGARVEIDSSKPDELFNSTQLDEYPHGNRIEIPFTVTQDSDSLEVRLFVTSETDIIFKDYEIFLR